MSGEGSTTIGRSTDGVLGGWSSAVRSWMRRFRRHRLAVAGAAFMVLLTLFALLAPVVAPHDPNAIVGSAVWSSPSSEHLLGTDSIGRDVLSRLLEGARVSVTVGVAAAVSATVVGLILGLVAGLMSGFVDSLVMRLVDIVRSFPSLVVLLLLVTILGPSIGTVILAIAFLEWPLACRIVRQVSLTTREMDFVRAARAIGSGNLGIMFRHMVKPVIPALTVVTTLLSAGAILLEAALSFLGLGVQRPQATWGSMLQDAQSLAVLQEMPWLWVPPGVAIASTVLAINFVGDGLRDAFDVRLAK